MRTLNPRARQVLTVALLLLCCGHQQTARAEPQPACIREDFNSLEMWRHQEFRNIERRSSYGVETVPEGSVLRASSQDSASCLIYRKSFNVYDCPVISWRWKVSKVYEQGDAASKSGDDYPLRVYVLFEYDPDTAGLGTRLKYGMVKTLYGEYPPDSTLNYIWASKVRPPRPIPNAFTDRAMMIPVQSGPARVKTWVTETRNILKDYREAFGQQPPANATLAVMNDADNTGESSVSFLDFIQVGAADGSAE
jgi:hypothetical protein